MTSVTPAAAAAARIQLRQIIDGDACVFPASVHDPISARIAEELGFEMGMFAGSVASLTVLGADYAWDWIYKNTGKQAHPICREAFFKT